MDTMVIAERPMPASLAEACGWLLAAEGTVGTGVESDDVISAVVAGDALDVLLEVQPPYPPIRQPVRRVSLLLTVANARAALECAGGGATTVEERLRVARALRLLRGHAFQ
jgi:hypothetical protein